VIEGIRERIERLERETLSPYAKLASDSAGRTVPETPDPLRTCFMRDRDRILHSKPFRRLKHKTQVFIAPGGDHYRTRLTHTLEVAQIARTIGRALKLNEDLIEAVALGHDVGHTPFGHAGEAAMDEALRDLKDEGSEESRGTSDELPDEPKSSIQNPKSKIQNPLNFPDRFRHFEQSLRVLEVLEGLNLTFEVKSGIAVHSKGKADLTDADGEPTSTLEAAVVRIADRIAYLNHDLDDARRAGFFAEPPAAALAIGASHSKRITAMVHDVIEHSLNRPAISLSKGMTAQMNELKDWMFENVYEAAATRSGEIARAKEVVRALFRHFCVPGNLPEGYEGVQGAVDYVAGMTDRFALEAYASLPAAVE
jgi:dGTPase